MNIFGTRWFIKIKPFRSKNTSYVSRFLFLLRLLPNITAIILLLMLIMRFGNSTFDFIFVKHDLFRFFDTSLISNTQSSQLRRSTSLPIEPAAGPATFEPAEALNSSKSFAMIPAEIMAMKNMTAELAHQRAALDERERSINQRETLLRQIEERIKSELARLQKLEELSQHQLHQALTEDSNRLKQISDIYVAMKPKQAAIILSQMSTDRQILIAKMIQSTKLSAIMSAMSPDQAGKLSDHLLNLKQ